MRLRHLVWIALYFATMIAVVWGLFAVRQRTIAAFAGNAQARAQWQQWRSAAAQQASSGPVRRRVPKGSDPPGLVLMRDHFPQMLAGGVIFSSLLFGALAWTIEGAVFSAGAHRQTEPSKIPVATRKPVQNGQDRAN